ncbi:MAG: ribbon-helix-helix protein, CopG family [Candidatus Sericytochromatia bacterium]|nr:ribbon-helix-helix protein, CopG family [Candidatus Tanganyikabacteria bacterium]
MVRTQIQLTEEQAERLKAVAARQGISQAEAIRLALDFWLPRIEQTSRRELRQRAMQSFGKFRDIEGKTDVSVNHDDYYVEAVWEMKGRRDPR